MKYVESFLMSYQPLSGLNCAMSIQSTKAQGN